MKSFEAPLTILKASLLDTTGVGCFAAVDIPSGTRLSPPDDAPARRLEEHEIPDSHLKYCPLLENGLFLAPEDFSLMSVYWYINHSKDPSVGADGWKLQTVRDIEEGEEMTLFYPDLLTHPKNKTWVVKGEHY